MKIKDLRPKDAIFLNDKERVIGRVVDTVIPADLPGWLYVYLVGEPSPELLPGDRELDPKNVVWLVSQT
jgi:hypothetical protein